MVTRLHVLSKFSTRGTISFLPVSFMCRRAKWTEQTVKYWYRIMCLEIEYPIKQCWEWHKGSVSVRTLTIELKEELYDIGLASVCSS